MPWTANVSGPSWLTLAPSSGTASPTSAVAVTAYPSGLSPGVYHSTIQINAPQASNSPQIVAVTLVVIAAQASNPPGFSVDTNSLSLSSLQGGPSASQTVNVAETGSGSVTFTATASTNGGGNWLTVAPASGSGTASAPAPVVVTASSAGLDAGVYSGSVRISAGGVAVNIPVTYTVTTPQTGVILVSQSGLTFNAAAQGGVPLPQSFSVLNQGAGSMNWSAAASTTSGGSWLHISPSSGTVMRPLLDISVATVSVNPAGLAPGAYFGQITISSPQSEAGTQVVVVTLNVLPAGTPLPPQVYPSGLIFTGSAGASPPAQTVSAVNLTGNSNAYISGLIGSNFTYAPADAALPTGQATQITVTPDFSQLQPGAVSGGSITLQFSDGSPTQTISVLMIAPPAGPASCGPLHLVMRSSFQGLTVRVGQPFPVEVEIADGCGAPLEPGPSQPRVVAFFNGASVSMQPLGNGIWQAGWTPAAAGSIVITVQAAAEEAGSLVGGASPAVVVQANGASSASNAPVPAAIAHAASEVAGVPVAPGELVAIYGQNLAASTSQAASAPWPTTLGTSQVLVGGLSSPLNYISKSQINVQIPYNIPVNTQSELVILNGNGLSTPIPITVAAAQPGIFTANQTGGGQGIILKSDGVTLAQGATPAQPQEIVVLYCTGLGAVAPALAPGAVSAPLPAGAAAPASPLWTTVNPVTATIGGVAAPVSFAGLTPGFVGLYQVNVMVPATAAGGPAVPVTLTAAGQTSPVVTMAIAGAGQVSLPPALSLDTKTAALAVVQGGSAVSQTVHIQNPGGGTLTFTAVSSVPWLSISPAVASVDAGASLPVVITALPGTLSPGGYSGVVTFSSPVATAVIPISLTVTPPPQLSLDTTSMVLAASVIPVSQTAHVMNLGGGSLSFMASSSASWLTVSPNSGTITSTTSGSVALSSPVALTVTANPAGLVSGAYNGTVTVTGGGSTIAIAVSLTVGSGNAAMVTTESAMAFTTIPGGAPVKQNFGILNTGTGAMDWQAQASVFVNGTLTTTGTSWMQLSPASGAVSRPYLDAGEVTVQVDPTNLSFGTYFGRITLTSATATNSPVVVQVTVNVLAPGSSPIPTVAPSDLVFSSSGGATPAPQSFQITAAGKPVNFSIPQLVGIATTFTYTPSSGSVSPGYPATVQVVPTASSIAAGGITHGTAGINFDDGSPPAAVWLTVAVAPSSGSGKSCQPSSLAVTFQSPGAGFTVQAGQPAALAVRVIDSCGNAVTSPQGQVLVSFSNGDTPVHLIAVSGGVWQGTWIPKTSGPVTIQALTIETAGAAALVGGHATVSGTVQ